MFNSKANLEEKTENLVNGTKSSAEEIGSEISKSAKKITSKSKSELEDREDQATELISALKSFLNDYSSAHNLHEKKELLAKANAAKDAIAEKIETAAKECKDTAEKTVHDHPFGSVAAAAGAGLLLGYFISTKK